jgi:uncharacterized protein
MENDAFEWDDAKAEANFRKHKVRFEHAAEAREDPYALIELDDNQDYGEDRFIPIGQAADGVLSVVSAREANNHERRNYRRAPQED